MDLHEYLENYIAKNGHSKKTFKRIIKEFKIALLDHAIKIDGSIIYDDNDYE